jgi:hypothetical protein
MAKYPFLLAFRSQSIVCHFEKHIDPRSIMSVLDSIVFDTDKIRSFTVLHEIILTLGPSARR